MGGLILTRSETTSAPVLRQVTLTTVQKSQENRSKFFTGFVRMCLASNIPLEKVDKMTSWIKKINPQGGALSSADNLRTYYIPKVAEEVHGAVSVFLDECRKNNKKLSIIVDESTDQRERQILNILVRVGETWHHEFKLAKQCFLLLNALFKKQNKAGPKFAGFTFRGQMLKVNPRCLLQQILPDGLVEEKRHLPQGTAASV